MGDIFSKHFFMNILLHLGQLKKNISLPIIFCIGTMLYSPLSSIAQSDEYTQLKTQFILLKTNEKHDSALIVARQMNDWALKNETDTSLRYVEGVRFVGACLLKLELYDTCIIVLKKALSILEKQNRLIHRDYTETLSWLGIAYKDAGDYKNSELSLLKAIEIRTLHPTLQGDKPRYLNNLGFLYVSMGMYDEAETKINEALTRFKVLYPKPEDSIEYIYVIHSLACVKMAKADYGEAEILFYQYCNIMEKSAGQKISLLTCYIDLSINAIYLKKYDQASQYLAKADSIILSKDEFKHHLVNSKLSNTYGLYYSSKKDFDKSLKFYNNTIAFLKERGQIKNIEYALACQGIAADYLKKEKFDSAFIYAKNTLEMRKNLLGSLHPEYASALKNMADIYSSQNQYKEAIQLYLEVLTIYERIFDLNHKSIARVNEHLAENNRKLGLYKTAILFSSKAIAIYEHNIDLSGQARMKNSLGILNLEMGNLEEGEQLINEAIDYQKVYYKNDSTKFYLTIGSLAKVKQEQGDFAQAELYYDQWWSIIRTIPFKTEVKCTGLFEMSQNALRSSKLDLAKKHLLSVDSILLANPNFEKLATAAKIHKLFGDISFSVSQYDSAFNSYNHSSNLLEELELTESHEYAEIMLGFSNYFIDAKTNYHESINFANKAAMLQLILLGDQHPAYAKSLNLLGTLYLKTSNYDSALVFFQKAMNIYLISLGEDHLNYAESLKNLGVFYSTLGLYEKALPFFQKSLEINLIHFKEPQLDVATLYSYMGDVHMNNSNYKLADENYDKALVIFEEIYKGKNSPDLSLIFRKIASLKNRIGNEEEQEENLLLAFNMQKNISEQSEGFAQILNELGTMYTSMGNYEKGQSYLRQALIKFEKIEGIGKIHPIYAICVNDLGRNYLSLHDYTMADSLFKLALEIWIKVYNHVPNYWIANSNRNIGNVLFEQGEYVEAEKYYLIALQIMQKTMGEHHDYTLDSKSLLAKCYMKQGKLSEAYAFYTDIYDQKTKKISLNFEWLSDNEKEILWKKEKSFYNDLSWFANQSYAQLQQAAGLNFNAILFSKCTMLEAKLLRNNFDKSHEDIGNEIAIKNKLVEKLMKEGKTAQKEIKRIENSIDSLQSLLNLSFPEFAQQKKNLTITWQQIQQNLNSNEAAIEFVRYDNKEDGLVHYNALILKKGKNPILVQLCKEQELQAISPMVGFSAYYPLIWKPMEDFLQDVSIIYYSPIGELNNVPFHAIYGAKDKGDVISQAKIDKRGIEIESESAESEENASYLMDQFTLHHLTSTRSLAMGLKQKEKEPICKTITLVGGVNYDYLPVSESNMKKHKNKKPSTHNSQNTTEKWLYLPGTKLEVEKINQQVSSFMWTTQLIEGDEASSEKVSNLEGKEANCVLHLATHGYAFPEDKFSDTSHMQNNVMYNYHYSPYPMVRSGLILAGGNWAWTGSDTLTKLGAAKNGILTALEVSNLNLKNTKLVVLSACETGLGKIDGSEGTFGLKRGFKLAGVDQIIVSLWSVPDKQTMELMTLFYADLTKTLNPVLSFSKAQKEMRRLYPTDPNKWAGFVLVR